MKENIIKIIFILLMITVVWFVTPSSIKKDYIGEINDNTSGNTIAKVQMKLEGEIRNRYSDNKAFFGNLSIHDIEYPNCHFFLNEGSLVTYRTTKNSVIDEKTLGRIVMMDSFETIQIELGEPIIIDEVEFIDVVIDCKLE